MEFEWDDRKAATNARKHGVTFDQAISIFQASRSAIFDDETHSEDELRFIAIGVSDKGTLLSVSFTWRGNERIRIISAKPATRNEARLYAHAKDQES